MQVAERLDLHARGHVNALNHSVLLSGRHQHSGIEEDELFCRELRRTAGKEHAETSSNIGRLPYNKKFRGLRHPNHRPLSGSLEGLIRKIFVPASLEFQGNEAVQEAALQEEAPLIEMVERQTAGLNRLGEP